MNEKFDSEPRVLSRIELSYVVGRRLCFEPDSLSLTDGGADQGNLRFFET